MTLLIYYTFLWYINAPLWLWIAGAAVWALRLAWNVHLHKLFGTCRIPATPNGNRQ